MKLEIKAEEIYQYVSLVDRVSKKRSLGNNLLLHAILIEAKDGKIILTSINNMGIKVEQDAKIYNEGIVLVPGYILYGLVSNFSPEVIVTLERVEKTLHIKSSTSEVEIEIYDESEFPNFLDLEEKKSVVVSSNTLVSGIEDVAYASQPSVSMPALASVYIYTDNGKLYFVAADVHRMAEIKNNLIKLEEEISLLIPIENIPDILFILKSIGKTDVEVSFNNQHAVFSVSGIVFFTRLIEGNFPDYKKIIPDVFQTNVTLKKSDLLSLFKKVNYFSSKFKEMSIEIDSDSGNAICTIENKGVGKIREKIPARIEGDSITEKFNYQFISDSLQSIKTEDINISFSGDRKPIVVKNTSDDSFIYVVAPLIT